VHELDPGWLFEFCPHWVHVEPPADAEKVPAWQFWQVELDWAATTREYVPARQFWHTVAPVPGLYWPAEQFWHTPAPVVGLYPPAEQFWHTPLVSAPVVVEYWPTEQFWHTVAADRLL